MEDEINLRPYIVALLKGWFYILGAAIGIALIAVVYYKFIKEPVYEARALVMPLPPLYDLVLSPEFVTNESLTQRGYSILPELAEADQVMALLLEQAQPFLDPSGREKMTLQTLGGMTDVVVKDANSMYLSVTYTDPEMAAQIANLWADIFMGEVNRIFGEGQDEIAFLESELISADMQRAIAEQAVIDFKGEDTTIATGEKLHVLRAYYNQIAAEQTNLIGLTRDIASLRSQLELLSASQIISWGDELSIVSMQFRLHHSYVGNLQLQINSTTGFSDRTAGEAVAFLDDLSQIAQEKSTVLEEQLVDLETEMLTLQQDIEAVDTQAIRLADDRSLAIELYSLLSTKLAESKITTQEALVSYMKVGSYAAVPSSPQSPGLMMLLVVGGGAGAFLSAAILIGITYLRLNPLTDVEARQGLLAPDKLSGSDREASS
ncbi:MAG: hypothetical protein JW862_15700 [Anaerolineales bacterium]|nr:hypothetical protein [Anaerolineales bacterium]